MTQLFIFAIFVHLIYTYWTVHNAQYIKLLGNKKITVTYAIDIYVSIITYYLTDKVWNKLERKTSADQVDKDFK